MALCVSVCLASGSLGAPQLGAQEVTNAFHNLLILHDSTPWIFTNSCYLHLYWWKRRQAGAPLDFPYQPPLETHSWEIRIGLSTLVCFLPFHLGEPGHPGDPGKDGIRGEKGEPGQR